MKTVKKNAKNLAGFLDASGRAFEDFVIALHLSMTLLIVMSPRPLF